MDERNQPQQSGVYHVCQHCAGAGCSVCSELCLLDGDIDTNPEQCASCGGVGHHFDGCHWVEYEHLDILDGDYESPINGVIGIKARYVLCGDCLRALPYTDELHQTEGSCVCGGDMCGCEGCNQQVHMLMAGELDYRVLDLRKPIYGWSAENGSDLTPAPKADPVCPKCGKSCFDSASGCLAPVVYSPAVGDWSCAK